MEDESSINRLPQIIYHKILRTFMNFEVARGNIGNCRRIFREKSKVDSVDPSSTSRRAFTPRHGLIYYFFNLIVYCCCCCSLLFFKRSCAKLMCRYVFAMGAVLKNSDQIYWKTTNTIAPSTVGCQNSLKSN